MNVGRGLFRAWIVFSIIWIAGASSAAYVIVSPDTIKGSFIPRGQTVDGKKPLTDDSYKALLKKPFYEVMRSPSAENLNVNFGPVHRQDKSAWESDVAMVKVDMSDGSRIYMSAKYSEADQNYIAQQFWDQRWSRWGNAAGTIALWAFVSCLLISILGYALLWIGRGFTRA